MFIKNHRYLRNHIIPQIKLHGLWGVYLNEFFRRIATSLIGLYLPIFIWQKVGSYAGIPVFFMIFSISAFLAEYPEAKIIQKVGVDWGMLMGSVFRGLFILTLILVKIDVRFLWLAAIFYGLSQPLDWLPYHYVITKISNQKIKVKSFGKNASLSAIMTQSAAALGPFIGGLIVFFLGDTILYLFASFFLILSASVVFLDDFDKKGMHVNLREVFTIIKDLGLYKHVFTFFIIIFNDFFYQMLWPVFLFLTLGGIVASGGFQTASIIFVLILTFLSGKLVDKNNFKIMYLGAFLTIISWFLRFITTATSGLFLADISYNSSGSLLWTPVQSLLYKRAGKKYTMEFWLVHELVWYLLCFIVSFIIFLVFTKFSDLKSAFVLIGTVNLFLLLIPQLYQGYIKRF